MTAKDVRRKKLLRTIGLHFSGVDTLKALGMYLMSVMGCLLLRSFDMHNDTSYVAMIFLLDVFLTAFWTDGYLLGIIAAVVGVFSVDYIFTYPFWHISFTLTGFPLTFLVMMTISILTATVTSRAKQMEQIRRDAEQDGTLTQEQREQLLRSTNEDAQWLIRIVENLLSITRISSEEARVKKLPEPAEEVIESAVAKTHKHYPEVDIRVHLPDELMMVPMDPLLIEQVLVNLMENAVIHGETNHIDVSLREEGSCAVITVSDDGRGIPQHLLPKLFEGSARSDRSQDGKRSMGIGLSVCRTIVLAHGGVIRGDNKPEGGAVFTVTLPMKGESDED